MHGKQDNLGGEPGFDDPASDLDSGHFRHPDVQDGHIRAKRFDEPQSLSAVTDLGQEFHALFRLEKGRQTLADNGMVIR